MEYRNASLIPRPSTLQFINCIYVTFEHSPPGGSKVKYAVK